MRVFPLWRHCTKPNGRWRSTSASHSSVDNWWRSTQRFVPFVRGTRKAVAGRPREKTAAAVHQEITREINRLPTRIFARRHKTGDMDLEAVELALRASLHQAGTMALTARSWVASSRGRTWMRKAIPCGTRLDYVCGRHRERRGIRPPSVCRSLAGGWTRAEKRVGDGAEWIWSQADLHFPGAIPIVDLYHAHQHLWVYRPNSIPTIRPP
jgi:hypothetical protein